MREFLPAPLLMYAWTNQRALKDNHLVKCIHYTGEEKETACLLVFWRCLVQTCYHSVLYHNNYSTVVQISNLDYCSSHWHGEELYFNMLMFLSSSKPASSLPCLLLGFFSPPAMAASSEIGKSFLCCSALSPSSTVIHPTGRVDFLITASVVCILLLVGMSFVSRCLLVAVK